MSGGMAGGEGRWGHIQSPHLSSRGGRRPAVGRQHQEHAPEVKYYATIPAYSIMSSTNISTLFSYSIFLPFYTYPFKLFNASLKIMPLHIHSKNLYQSLFKIFVSLIPIQFLYKYHTTQNHLVLYHSILNFPPNPLRYTGAYYVYSSCNIS